MPAANIAVRPATPADAAAIAALLTELGHAADAALVPPRLASVVAGGGAAYVATDDAGIAVGFISLASHAVIHSAGPVAVITALVVGARARRRGVGQRLVAAAKEWATAAACVRLIVTSAEHRADAHAFYPACGMEYTGRRFATALAPGRREAD